MDQLVAALLVKHYCAVDVQAAVGFVLSKHGPLKTALYFLTWYTKPCAGEPDHTVGRLEPLLLLASGILQTFAKASLPVLLIETCGTSQVILKFSFVSALAMSIQRRQVVNAGIYHGVARTG